MYVDGGVSIAHFCHDILVHGGNGLCQCPCRIRSLESKSSAHDEQGDGHTLFRTAWNDESTARAKNGSSASTMYVKYFMRLWGVDYNYDGNSLVQYRNVTGETNEPHVKTENNNVDGPQVSPSKPKQIQ